MFIPNNSPPVPHQVAVFRALNGETNDLTVTGGNGFVFLDSLALLTAGAGCVLQPNASGTCEPGTTVVEAHLKDENDVAHVLISGTALVWAGSGDDTVVADSFTGATFVYGEGGDDDIAANGEGGQFADGGSGDDIVHAGGNAGNATGLGGSGTDIIRYQTVLGGHATLDGGKGDDTIVSQPAGGTATGGAGDDIIAINGLVPQFPGGGFTVSGGDGDDTDHRQCVCRHHRRRRRTGLHRRPQRRRGHRGLWLRLGMPSVSMQPIRSPRTARSSVHSLGHFSTRSRMWRTCRA